MRRIILLSIIAVAAGLTACTDAGRSLIILQNQPPEADCFISGTEGAAFRGVGALDVNSPGGYLFTPLVKNVAEGSSDDPSARLAQMRGADVVITFQEGFLPEAVPADITDNLELTHRISGSVDPDGGTVGLAFTAVSANMTRAIKNLGLLSPDGSNFVTIIAKVTVFGDMDGGTVQSREFEYPIQVCDGCLTNDVGPCDQLPTDFAAATGFECVGFFQDSIIDCCSGPGGEQVCPAVSTAVGG